MSIREQLFVISGMFFIGVFYIRGFIGGLLDYQLNRKAYNKRKEGQSLKEAILYSRFRNEIPNILLILYYLVLIIHAIAVIVCFSFNITNLNSNIGDFITRVIFYFDGFWMIILQLMFWRSKPGFAYERWISKKRGMANKRKK